MPRGYVSQQFDVSSAVVFAVLHDYPRRLQWDTLLSEAYLVDAAQAALGAVAVCRAQRKLGGIALRTRYISFRPGRVAAVAMEAPTSFFLNFAAAIRHRDLASGGSVAEYRYHFLARPRWLRWLLHPFMHTLLCRETQRRLTALADYLRS
jgi:hypothetical protein